MNLWFDLISLLALFGATGARFRSGEMATAMFATAIAQVLVAIILQLDGHFSWVFTSMWLGAWLLSAWLFRKSAQDARSSSKGITTLSIIVKTETRRKARVANMLSFATASLSRSSRA